MNWKFVIPLQSENLIIEYEKKIGYVFPEDFKACVKLNNHGYPEKEVFYSWRGKRKRERVFNLLLSFNKEDRVSIWERNDWRGRSRDWFEYSNGEIENYVVFADDPFGNPICYDKRTDEIVWIDHEEADFSIAVEKIADSFTELINSLKNI